MSDLTRQQLCAALGISESNLAWRFLRPGDRMSGVPWTRLEDSILRDLYPTHSAAEIAALLGVGVRTVYRTAARLRLKKSREWIAENARKRSNRPDHGGAAHRFQLWRLVAPSEAEFLKNFLTLFEKRVQ